MPEHDPFAPASAASPPSSDTTPAEASQTPVQGPGAVGDVATATETSQKPAEGEAGVPAGTTKEVLAWVGDDKDKARAALAAEQASDEPRTGLSRRLEELLG